MGGVDSKDGDELREQLERSLTLGRRMLGFWRVTLCVVLLGEIACAVFLLLVKPRYKSQTALLYAEAVRTVETGEPAATPRSLAARIEEMLRGRRGLAGVVEQLDLYSETRRAYGMAEAVDELYRHIEFHAPGGDTFTIAFVGESPEQAQTVTSRLAELVIEQDREQRSQQVTQARDFLAGEKQRAQKRLRSAEEELAGFMAEHPRFALDVMPLATGAAIRASVGAQGPTDPGRQRLVRVGPTRPGTSMSDPTRPGTSATSPLSASSAPAEIDPLLQAEVARARAALASARESLNEKRSLYTDVHPDVRAARDVVAQAQRRLDGLVTRLPVAVAAPAPAPPLAPKVPAVSDPATPKYVAVPAREPAAAAPPSSESIVALETEWARLTRAVSEARQRHDQVEAALFKADLASSSASETQGSRVSVIDPAYLPHRPLPPGRRAIAAMFLGGSLLLGVLVALGLALVDDRIHCVRDVDPRLEVLVEVPWQPSRARRARARARRAGAAEALRQQPRAKRARGAGGPEAAAASRASARGRRDGGPDRRRRRA